MSNEKKDDGGSAYPHPYEENGNGNVISYGSVGMSLRDRFAGLAMQGLIRMDETQPSITWGQYDRPEDLASDAYKVADAMIKAREQ